jgi:hypothetical protein
VSAQYGAALFWLPLISILLQAVVNLLFVRYALYCGEPINVGILRMKPGPVFWMWVFAVLEIGGVMPYNASNAAVPLAAAFLGHLPAGAAEVALVKGLGIAVFLLSFVPLVFGGTVYRMLEKIMTAKLVFVLGFLGFVAVTMVSAPVVRDVVTGFFRFGTVPLRPETLIVGRHFNVQVEEDGVTYRVAGSWGRSSTSGWRTGCHRLSAARGGKPWRCRRRSFTRTALSSPFRSPPRRCTRRATSSTGTTGRRPRWPSGAAARKSGSPRSRRCPSPTATCSATISPTRAWPT